MNELIDLEGTKQYFGDCLSCDIVNGKVKPFEGILFENEYLIVSQDAELPINGFIIITIKRHVKHFKDLTFEEQNSVLSVLRKLLNILESNVCDEYNVLFEEKRDHIYFWLMPRHNWMIENFGKVLKNIGPIQKYAIENFKDETHIEVIRKTCKLIKEKMNDGE